MIGPPGGSSKQFLFFRKTSRPSGRVKTLPQTSLTRPHEVINVRITERCHPRLRRAKWTLCLLAFWMLIGGPRPCLAAPNELCSQDIHSLVESMVEAYARVHDYTTIFFRRGLNEEELCPKETILLKFRKPFSIYMKWIEEPKKDREILYVEGWNEGMCRISMGSFPDFTFNLDPESGHIKNDSFGHTVLEAGIGHLVETLAKNLRKSMERPQDACKVLDLGISEVHGEKVRCLEGIYPEAQPGKYYAPKIILCLSVATSLPVQARVYNQFGEMTEEFGFKNTKINVGLTDKDFNPENPDYDF